jgi:integrase
VGIIAHMLTETAVIEMKKPRREYGTGCITARPNGRFQIQYYDALGRKRRETVSTYAKAEKLLQKRAAMREAGTLESAADSRIKIDALAEAYKVYAGNSAPKSAYWIALVWRCHLEPVLGGKVAARIASDDLEGYIASRLAEKAAPGTINRELTVLKAMLNHAAESDPPKLSRVPKFPAKLREANPRSGFIDDKQYAALVANCKQTWLKALLAIAYNFGFRKGELLGLCCGQIDLEARTIHLLPGTTKSDKGRTVPMTEEIFGLLSECVRGKIATDAVFTWGDGRPVKDFRGAFAAITKAAGLPDLLLHDFRRSAVRRMLRRGISKHTAERISGHATDSIFDRYDIVDESDLAAAAKKLE